MKMDSVPRQVLTRSCCNTVLLLSVIFILCPLTANGQVGKKSSAADSSLFYDSHFHLTNFIQEGRTAKDFLKIMGSKVGRSTLFGIPLQQQWSARVSGDDAPKYYLDTDAHLYYYSFTDAYIAMQYKSLSKDEQARFDPMITGFNPTDMYAADHIRRVLLTFPGVFSGIGEFSIHKEFVSSKIAGDIASLSDPALDRILDFAAEAGLVVILHNDIDKPFPKPGTKGYLAEIKDLFRRHPKTSIIWAHIGMGRIIQPMENQAELVEEMLQDSSLNHVCFDISWDEVAKYLMSSDKAIQRTAGVLAGHPDRFVFGTDIVAPRDEDHYLSVYRMYEPLWKALSPETSAKVRMGNYRRMFDAARTRVRAWEKANGK